MTKEHDFIVSNCSNNENVKVKIIRLKQTSVIVCALNLVSKIVHTN